MRYFEEVKKVNRGNWKPSEFAAAVFGQSPDWADWQAAFWIYSEDGGKMDFQEFMQGAPESPIPYNVPNPSPLSFR